MKNTLAASVVMLGLAALSTTCAHAQQPTPYPGYLSAARYYPNSSQTPAAAQQARPRYPYLGAPMYPSPRQDIPVQVGGTMITNQAFAPHEMMHAHSYRALYAPFYYKVKGGWLWTPFGMESHDKWELVGTEVKVNYRSRYSLFSGFKKPLNNVFKKNMR